MKSASGPRFVIKTLKGRAGSPHQRRRAVALAGRKSAGMSFNHTLSF
jgi:hypothetical protein